MQKYQNNNITPVISDTVIRASMHPKIFPTHMVFKYESILTSNYHKANRSFEHRAYYLYYLPSDELHSRYCEGRIAIEG